MPVAAKKMSLPEQRSSMHSTLSGFSPSWIAISRSLSSRKWSFACMSPPMVLIAHAASTPSVAPPEPIMQWMPNRVSSAASSAAATSPAEMSLIRAPTSRICATVAELLTEIEHRRLVLLALADDDRAFHVDRRERGADGFDCARVGSLLVATALQRRGCQGARFGHAQQLEREVAIDLGLFDHS